jgi:hypothetical protein
VSFYTPSGLQAGLAPGSEGGWLPSLVPWAQAPAERWLPVARYVGYYEVSDLGRVRSLPRVIQRSDGVLARYKGKILSTKPTPAGYCQVLLSKDGKAQLHIVHTLVLEAFVSERPPGAVGRHGIKGVGDNSLSNLSWGSYTENMLDRQRDGTDQMRNRITCLRNHFLASPNLVESVFNKSGHRICKACAYSATYCHQAELKGVRLDPDEQARYHYRRIIARSFGLSAAEARQVGKTGLIPMPGLNKLLPIDNEAALSLRKVAA